MTSLFSILLWSITGAAICIAAGLTALKAAPENIKKIEQLTRNRWIGLFLGWFALFICVPHAEAVSPAFLIKFLYPLAAAVPVLGFFFIDYPASRAVSGTLILSAYNLVHLAFDINAFGMSFFAVCGWIAGFWGIWCSGLPWAWRDMFRKCAANAAFRKIAAGIFFFFALVFITFGGVGCL